MKALLVVIAFLGLCALTYFSQNKAREATKEAETLRIQSVETKENLAASERRIADLEAREKERTAQRDEAEAQLSDLKKKADEDAEKLTELKATLEAASNKSEEKKTEDNKGQMTEVENLQQKLKEAEEQNAATKAELTKAQADLTAARTDLQRLQQRPPIGGAIRR